MNTVQLIVRVPTGLVRRVDSLTPKGEAQPSRPAHGPRHGLALWKAVATAQPAASKDSDRMV